MQKLANKKRLARKDIKWIESRFSFAHRMRITISAFKAVGIAAAGCAQIHAIRNTKADKVEKTKAIDECLIATNSAIASEFRNSHSFVK